MPFAVKRSDYFNAKKAKRMLTHVLLRLIHCFSVSQRYKVIREKEKVHDLTADKMVFAVKRSDYFYPRKAKRTPYVGFSSALSESRRIKAK